MPLTYRSIKTYGHDIGLSCAFRQWRSQSHCRFLHGYALAIRLTFEATELDANNWVVDFGGMKGLKTALETMFDHKTLVARDDPQRSLFHEMNIAGLIDMVEVEATGCEKFAEMIFATAQHWLKDAGYSKRVRLIEVEVREHGANAASVAS